MSMAEIGVRNLVVREERDDVPDVSFDIDADGDGVEVAVLVDGTYHKYVGIHLGPTGFGVLLSVRDHGADRHVYEHRHILFDDYENEGLATDAPYEKMLTTQKIVSEMASILRDKDGITDEWLGDYAQVREALDESLLAEMIRVARHLSKFPEGFTEAMRQAVERFKKEICDRKDVDPKETLDWDSLAYGFFLACGLAPKQARITAGWVNRIGNFTDPVRGWE